MTPALYAAIPSSIFQRSFRIVVKCSASTKQRWPQSLKISISIQTKFDRQVGDDLDLSIPLVSTGMMIHDCNLHGGQTSEATLITIRLEDGRITSCVECTGRGLKISWIEQFISRFVRCLMDGAGSNTHEIPAGPKMAKSARFDSRFDYRELMDYFYFEIEYTITAYYSPLFRSNNRVTRRLSSSFRFRLTGYGGIASINK